ncbi:MAG TPA: amino acid adenylation domain-containing protein, partial [Longimicrobium sp.]|nr:amino acid adenylation domain-containing protein [Longimicrobium sp.]
MLLLNVHHIAADGWSWGVMMRELTLSYRAFAGGGEPALAELPVQYADYALWQRARLAGDAVRRERAFWRGRLAGAPALLELPYDRPRPAEPDEVGAAHHFTLVPAVARAARELARREGATLYMVLLAAWSAVLHRWSGQEDVVVGSPVAGRGLPEVEGLVGLFVNTLAMRTDLGGDPAFRTLLARVRESTLQAYAHQDVPFEELVQELGVERSLSHAPVFQVMFGVLSAPAAELSLEGVRVRTLPDAGGTARLDLSVQLEEHDDELRGLAEYATALWDAATIERMTGHFGALFSAALADPDTRLSALPLMDAAERAAVIDRPNETARDWPFVAVHRRFAEQAARTPDAVAVEGVDGALTYAELDALSAGVAAALRGRGAGRGSLVAVCAERSVRMVAALLGVLRAGAAYLPLDPEYPAERLAYMLEDSGASLLLLDRALEDRLPASPIGRIVLDDVVPADPVDADVDAEDLAYVIYTSGSTGRPKGVMVRHGGVSSFLRSMAEAPGLRADDVVLAVTTIAFDISVLELFLPLTLGARTVVATREQAADPALLATAIQRSGATTMQATPATWAMLLASGWTPRGGLRLLSGGEALPRSVADALQADGAELWNLYGPTETTVWSAAARVPAEGEIPLGAPIANTTLYVLDPAGNPAPLGVPGELFIGGAGVARGYLRRPALTAERFVPDAFGAPGSRLYRTGDRVRRRTDGALEFLGRVDFQVKLRGFRIELGEIESALRAHPAVAGAAAAVRGEGADARLVAYLVARAPDAPPAGAELRAFLRERLPEYMLPSAFVALDAFPLTPNGKVDRKALPAPDAQVADSEGEAPRGATEQVLAGIWAELLGGGAIGRGDSFFERGGHSLLATRLMSRIARLLGVELPLRALFAAPTLAALAAEIEAARASADGAVRIPPIRPRPTGEPAVLSFAQERMWFLDRFAGTMGAYNIPLVLELAGRLDVDALRGALGDLAARHEALRTRIVDRDGRPAAELDAPAE